MDLLIISAIFGIIMMFAGLWVNNKNTLGNIAIAGFAILSVAGIAALNGTNIFTQIKGSETMLAFGRKEYYFITLTCLATVLYLILCVKPLVAIGHYAAEYLALLFFITCGIIISVSFQNLLMLFLGIEIISIPLYILTGSDKQNLKSNEASLKYFLMGAFSTGILLMGIALIYGATGSFSLAGIIKETQGVSVIYAIGVILLFVALCFKVSAAPFHFWTPDVYDGAPTAVTAYMATIAKGASFLAFLQLFQTSFSGRVSAAWMYMLMFIIIATLVIGNLTAVFQQSVKRMMSYSSIAQAGFMLFALMAINSTNANEGLVLYTLVYTLASLGIFAVLVRIKDYTFDGFNGLAKKEPLVALATTICLFSLAGIPLTGGFMGKWYMLQAVASNSEYWWLIFVAVLLAAVSIFYYFKVIQAMYFKTGEALTITPFTSTVKIALVAIVVVLLAAGIFPSFFTSFLIF